MGEDVYTQLLGRIGEANPQPRLTAMRRVVELLGDPQQTSPIIHITGTNGKTSVSRMAELLLRAHGLRTGLLTSPHLERFNERIMLDGEPVSDEVLEQAWQELNPILQFVDSELTASGEAPVSFFEATTALAFAVFADAPVDVMVLEVGMGGEWDATNVADADVAVFTPIDIDHAQQLGATREEIARTKAGIIKPRSVVVSAAQEPEVMAVLEDVSQSSGVSLVVAERDFGLDQATSAVGGQLMSVRGVRGQYTDVPLSLHGRHQAHNATLALAAVEQLLSGEASLNPEIVTEAFGMATSPGRFQRISVDPLLLVDAAHNPHGARSLIATLRETFPDREPAFLIGVLNDKDAEGIVEVLSDAASTFFVTSPPGDRAMPAEHLAQVVRDVAPEAMIHERDALPDAIESLRDWVGGAPNRVGIVTGSIMLVGAVLAYVRQEQWSGH